jgi:hypothetical protein
MQHSKHKEADQGSITKSQLGGEEGNMREKKRWKVDRRGETYHYIRMLRSKSCGNM